MSVAAERFDAARSIRYHLIGGLGAAGLLVGVIGGWAAIAQVNGAVVAPGLLVVESEVKNVQHPTGGVVGELRVRDGDHVETGDVLIRLDDIQTRANLQIILNDLDELTARQARDEAEQTGADHVRFPDELVSRSNDPRVAQLLRGEQNMFDLRLASRIGRKKQLREQITELREQIAGQVEQQTAKEREIDWIRQELKGVRDLWQKNLVQFNRVTALERDAAKLDGERGSLIASIAASKVRIAETELKIFQIDEDLRTDLGKDLTDIRAKMSTLLEKRATAEDQLRRIDIRAPQTGRVFQLAVHTIGGVIHAGDIVMQIVPERDKLIVEAKIAPQDIDQVHLDQPVVVRFGAFNQRTTPEVNGKVERISANVVLDPKTGVAYYVVRISVGKDELERLGDLKLVPGMPAEAFLQTSARTVLSYLVKPLHEQMNRAFREK